MSFYLLWFLKGKGASHLSGAADTREVSGLHRKGPGSLSSWPGCATQLSSKDSEVSLSLSQCAPGTGRQSEKQACPRRTCSEPAAPALGLCHCRQVALLPGGHSEFLLHSTCSVSPGVTSLDPITAVPCRLTLYGVWLPGGPVGGRREEGRARAASRLSPVAPGLGCATL